MKDHHSPQSFVRQATKPLYGEGELAWNRAFYVYPAYREQQRADYAKVTRAALCPADTQVMNDERFKVSVRQKLKELARAERKG